MFQGTDNISAKMLKPVASAVSYLLADFLNFTLEQWNRVLGTVCSGVVRGSWLVLNNRLVSAEVSRDNSLRCTGPPGTTTDAQTSFNGEKCLSFV